MAKSSLRIDLEWRLALFTAILLPLFIALGFWQLQRAEEKAELALVFEQRRQQAPASLDQLRGRPAEELAYYPVRLRGEFLPQASFLLDNRVLAGRFGNEAIAVMRLAGSAGLVLVNRGWIAADPTRRTTPDVSSTVGELEFTGHVYVPPGEPYLLGAQQLLAGWPKIIQAVQVPLLAQGLEDAGIEGSLFPYSVRIDAQQPGALEIDWKIVNVSPAKHQGYAFQWFAMGLALATIFVFRSSNLWRLLRGDRDSEQN